MKTYEKVNAVQGGLMSSFAGVEELKDDDIHQVREDDFHGYHRNGKPVIEWVEKEDIEDPDRFFFTFPDGVKTKNFYKDWYDMSQEDLKAKFLLTLGIEYGAKSDRDLAMEIVKRFKVKTILKMDSYDLEDVVRYLYKVELEVVATLECGNDSQHEISLDGYGIIPEYLTKLRDDGIIPETTTEVLISVCW
jgi:hypothetical protein